jgi:hypothetical protein
MLFLLQGHVRLVTMGYSAKYARPLAQNSLKIHNWQSSRMHIGSMRAQIYNAYQQKDWGLFGRASQP